MGERRRMQRAASATRRLSLRDRRHPPCPPTPYAATAWRRGCRGVAAHRYPVSAVRSPSCEGKLPLRWFSSSRLREGRRSGIMEEWRRTQRAASATRARFPYAPLFPPCAFPPPYPVTAWRRGCRGAAAHSCVSAVSRPSCEGTLPLRSLFQRYLREGRRSRGRMEARPWQIHGRRQMRGVPRPYAMPPSVLSQRRPPNPSNQVATPSAALRLLVVHGGWAMERTGRGVHIGRRCKCRRRAPSISS